MPQIQIYDYLLSYSVSLALFLWLTTSYDTNLLENTSHLQFITELQKLKV